MNILLRILSIPATAGFLVMLGFIFLASKMGCSNNCCFDVVLRMFLARKR